MLRFMFNIDSLIDTSNLQKKPYNVCRMYVCTSSKDSLYYMYRIVLNSM